MRSKPEDKYRDLRREELIGLLVEQDAKTSDGLQLLYEGQTAPWQIARRVKPRRQRIEKKLCNGREEEQSCNTVIEGENLQAMVSLYKYRGQVDLVLADPPYNTGQDFRYNDKWDEDPNDPDLGEIVPKDDGSKHSKWLRFMVPRLWMMREMLKPSGVLAVCIDHRELYRLGMVLDRMFGEKNRLAIINWKKSASRRNDKEHVSTATEYVLIYAKDEGRADTRLLERTEELNAGYKNKDNDPNGAWLGVAPWGAGRATHMGMVYAIQSPFTGKLYSPPGSRHWAFEKATIKSWLEGWGSEYEERDLGDGLVPGLVLKGAKTPRPNVDPMEDAVVARASRRAHKVRDSSVWPLLFFTKNCKGKPRKKTHLVNVKEGVIPDTFWADDDSFEPLELGSVSWSSNESGTSEVGARELTAILGDDHGFETVKPLKLFSKIIQIWCPPSGIVLDPFAGSGTTGHALLDLNAGAEPRESRRFILIEQGRAESGDPYARTLMAERLRRVVSGEWASGKRDPREGGFRFTSLSKAVDAQGVLALEREEMIDLLLTSHWDQSERSSAYLRRFPAGSFKYLFAVSPGGLAAC
jgi:adenine-specific DNA-methyltransferase